MKIIKYISIVLAVLVFGAFIAVFQIPLSSIVDTKKVPKNIEISELTGSLVEGSASAFVDINSKNVANLDLALKWHWCPQFSNLLIYCLKIDEHRFSINTKVTSHKSKIVLIGGSFKLREFSVSAPILNVLSVSGNFDIDRLTLDPKLKFPAILGNTIIKSKNLTFSLADEVLDKGAVTIVRVNSKKAINIDYSSSLFKLKSLFKANRTYETIITKSGSSDKLPPLLSLLFDGNGEYKTQGRF